MEFDLDAYRRLLEKFKSSGYGFSGFVESPPREGAVLLRHDIDFDLNLACEMAMVEQEIGVTSTYFLMMRNASYNLLAVENTELALKIRECGHELSLHFDPLIYEDFRSGLKQELEVFRSYFGVAPDCISIHRPSPFFLDLDSTIDGIRHTYQSQYCRSIKYFSDSQGAFRHGSPIESDEFAAGCSIHLLIHPIWWVADGAAPVEILGNFLDMRIARFQRHMAKNCKPYREIVKGEYD